MRKMTEQGGMFGIERMAAETLDEVVGAPVSVLENKREGLFLAVRATGPQWIAGHNGAELAVSGSYVMPSGTHFSSEHVNGILECLPKREFETYFSHAESHGLSLGALSAIVASTRPEGDRKPIDAPKTEAEKTVWVATMDTHETSYILGVFRLESEAEACLKRAEVYFTVDDRVVKFGTERHVLGVDVDFGLYPYGRD